MVEWKDKYQVMSFFKELIFFFISSFMSFYLHVKIIIPFFVYSDDYNPAALYPSLRKEDFPSCIFYPNLIPSAKHIEKYDVHILIPPKNDPSCKYVDNIANLSPLEITIPSCNQLTKV